MGSPAVGPEPGVDDSRVRCIRREQTQIVSVEKIGAGCGGRPRPGAVGDIAGTRIPLESSELASRTCGCEVSEDGFADRQAVVDHPFPDSDRLGEDSTTMRGTGPEWGLALQFNRFRNSYVTDGTRRKTTLLQWLRKTRNLCVDDRRHSRTMPPILAV